MKAADTSGTTIERNAAISSSSERPTTTPMNSGRRSLTRPAMSSNVAVAPPTCACAPVPLVAAGTTSSRRWSTSADVATSCGAVRGITVSVAASPARLITGGDGGDARSALRARLEPLQRLVRLVPVLRQRHGDHERAR